MNEALAANDNFYLLNTSNSRVIKSSLTSIDDYPKTLKVYRIFGSKFWQVRIYINGKYISKSLRTLDISEAKKLATEFFNDIKIKHPKEVLALSKPKCDEDLIAKAIDFVIVSNQEKVKRDEIKLASSLIMKGRLEGYIYDFFKKRDIKNINSQTLQDFVDFLTEHQLNATTIQGYLSLVNKVMRFLYNEKYLTHIPLLPKVKNQHNSRGAFTLTEYASILRQSRILTHTRFTDWGDGKRIWIKEKYQTMPNEMNALIRFMIYTFIRPGDIRQLQNKHIEIIKGARSYLRINLPEIKRHRSPIVSLPNAVPIYKRLLARQCENGYGRADDYVFFPEEPNRLLMLNIIGWLFNWILNELNIKRGPHNIDRSLYSLRHTSITFRLIYGGSIDLLTLARNARTSVEMIEKHYASTLSAEMNIALLHSKRRT
jgi:integrase